MYLDNFYIFAHLSFAVMLKFYVM